MGDTSLVSGLLPLLFFLTTPLAIGVAIGWRRNTWKKQLIVGAMAGAVYFPIIYVVNENFRLVPYEFPFSFYVWSILPISAGAVAITGWTTKSNVNRAFGIVAVLLTFPLVGIVVNRQYQYYPTVDSLLFDKVAANQVNPDDVPKIEQRVKETKQLPPNGSTVNTSIPGTTSGFQARSAYVYLPPAYFADPSPQLPVLILLHGFPGDPSDWERAGFADKAADAFASANQGKAPILVMPDFAGVANADTECVDTAKYGNADTYLTVDVPAFARATYHAAPGRESLGIAGLSTGGICALHLSLRHPDVFSTAGAYSADTAPTLNPPGDALKDLFGGNKTLFDEYDLTAVIPKNKYTDQSLWLEAGTEDPGDRASQASKLLPLLAPAGIDACMLLRAGGHDYNFWQQAIINSLPWLSYKLGLTPAPPPVPGAVCKSPA